MFGKRKVEEVPDMQYFTIYDSKVGVYRDPILAINQFDILRQIEATFRDPKFAQDQYVTNAEDFQLFKVGEYYRRSGEIVGLEPQHIANLHELKVAVLRSQAPVGAVGALSGT